MHEFPEMRDRKGYLPTRGAFYDLLVDQAFPVFVGPAAGFPASLGYYRQLGGIGKVRRHGLEELLLGAGKPVEDGSAYRLVIG